MLRADPSEIMIGEHSRLEAGSVRLPRILDVCSFLYSRLNREQPGYRIQGEGSCNSERISQIG